MMKIIELLEKNARVDEYKINLTKKESYELFFVKGKLETTRRTNTCDKEVTVYVKHGDYKGDSAFFVYPSTTEKELETLIDAAVEKALLIDNQTYELPEAGEGQYEVESNFAGHSLNEIAGIVAGAVFKAEAEEGTALNSVEVFVYRNTVTVVNSRGVNKTQVKYSAMVEAIPTYNGKEESVELYQQYNFNTLDESVITAEIEEKLREVKARHEAKKPEVTLEGNVILNKLELANLFSNIAYDLSYYGLYAKSNVHSKGDMIQKELTGDAITITMQGEAAGNIGSAKFDGDGMNLTDITIVEKGKAINYFGSSRFGQYLGEKPTGSLACLTVEPGTACPKCLSKAPYLEVVSMSGLQVDAYNDYIGGEVRLAYYNDGNTITPVTGISITGKLSEVLSSIRLAKETAVHNRYIGPKKAILSGMKIF